MSACLGPHLPCPRLISHHCALPSFRGMIVRIYHLTESPWLEPPNLLHLDLWFHDLDNDSRKYLVNRTRSVHDGIWNQDLLFLLPPLRTPPLKVVCRDSRDYSGKSLGETSIGHFIPLRRRVRFPLAHKGIFAGYLTVMITTCTVHELMNLAHDPPYSDLDVPSAEIGGAGEPLVWEEIILSRCDGAAGVGESQESQ